MNVLEKAKLIKELHQLLDGLEQRSLSFFEIARSKARVKEIFALCDEPIFKKQIFKFKFHTQPEKAVRDFAAQSLFQLSFRGAFQQDKALKSALYQYPDSGWAILYDPQEGWQIWLIPAPNRMALISGWGDLDDAYHWMLQQQQNYGCLKTDQEIRQIQDLIAQNIAKTLTEKSLAKSDDTLETIAQNKEFNSIDSSIAEVCSVQNSPATDISMQQSQTSEGSQEQSAIATEPDLSITASAFDQANVENSADQPPIIKNTPEMLQLNQYVAHIQSLHNEDASLQQLYRLAIPDLPEIDQYIDLLLHGAGIENWQHQPIYLAEQINQQGHFIKYVALLGAENQMQAMQFMQLFNAADQHALAAIKKICWIDWMDHFSQMESLFDVYTHKALCIWADENYMPFIPAQLIQTQKIIQFDESAADIKTPLLLLKERQKIRLIHGQKRLALSPTESAYPYFLLERHHGISWQMIQMIISQFKSPIDCRELYKEIQKHISD